MPAIDVAAPFIRKFEGCQLQAYADLTGRMTIGWGHTGPEVYEGLYWTQDQADAVQLSDFKDIWGQLQRIVSKPLTDKQGAALLSLAFNVGANALRGTGLITWVNAGNWIQASHRFPDFDHDGKTEVKGLLIRRFKEAAFFLEGSP